MNEINFREAEILCQHTDYAFFACQDDNPINWGDAAAFFMEGYNYAVKKVNGEKCDYMEHQALDKTD